MRMRVSCVLRTRAGVHARRVRRRHSVLKHEPFGALTIVIAAIAIAIGMRGRAVRPELHETRLETDEEERELCARVDGLAEGRRGQVQIQKRKVNKSGSKMQEETKTC